MIALIVARWMPRYGGLIAYQFPKQKLVFGPRNIEARINQDPLISQQIALWNQQGYRVMGGALYAIPIEQSLIYVHPLYLAAGEVGRAARAAPGGCRLQQPDRDGAHPRGLARAHFRGPRAR